MLPMCPYHLAAQPHLGKTFFPMSVSVAINTSSIVLSTYKLLYYNLVPVVNWKFCFAVAATTSKNNWMSYVYLL